jgi:FkbM family methyltransferase
VRADWHCIHYVKRLTISDMSARLRYLYRAYKYRFRVDPAEVRFVRESLGPGKVAVDIGCHKGAYAYWMRRSVGPSGVVYAFEPQPRQIAYLRNCFAAMHYDNVVLVPMAVSNNCGQMPLYMPAGTGLTHAASLEPRNGSPVSSTESVDITTLDDFFSTLERKAGGNGAVHFLKIDVEGHELAVLEGARRTLREFHPTILIECEARHRADGDVRPVFDLLNSAGYSGTFFCRGFRRPLAEFDLAKHQRLNKSFDRLPSDYVNNFAFELST